MKYFSPSSANPTALPIRIGRPCLDRELNKLQGSVILVGHSLGASVLLKYLSETACSMQIKGLFLVATPHWNPDGWNSMEWAVRKRFTTHLPLVPVYYFYHCLKDPVVPIEHLAFYRKAFPKAFFRELSCQDHVFSSGLKELLEDIRKVADNP